MVSKVQHKIDRLDTKAIPVDMTEIYCVMCVQNEMLRLPWLLQYHRNLGVSRFFIIDNASTDGSADYLLQQVDVHVFHTRDSYGESAFGISWVNLILDHFCCGHWCVVIDADELLIYPECENTGLRTLCDYLDSTGARAVYTQMFDMYSDKRVSKTEYIAGQPFHQVCPFFDGDGYTVVQTPRLFPDYQTYGGVRKRVFWRGQQEESLPPVLTKVALVKWGQNQKYLLSTHIMTPVTLAELSGALLHYKFFSDFHKRVLETVGTETQFDRSREYGVYASLANEQEQTSFFYEGSVEYTDSHQMVSRGFMKYPDSYRHFLNEH